MSIESLIKANTEALIALTAALDRLGSTPVEVNIKTDPAPEKKAPQSVAPEKPAASPTPQKHDAPPVGAPVVEEATHAQLVDLVGGTIKNKMFAREQAVAVLKQATGAEKLGDVKPEDYVKAANAFHKAIALHATSGFPENPAEYPADKFADFLARAK